MPASYAHHRFGAQAAALFPPEARRIIRQFQRLYDAGTQGPDIFFYHNILFRDRYASLARECHHLSGREFFTRCRSLLANDSSEAAQAYLWGLLTHYCLDAMVHPFVQEHVAQGAVSHTALETEFDRFLLQRDGVRQPATYDRGSSLKLTGGECVTAALFYPSATPGALRWSIRNMAFLSKLMALPGGTLRRVVEWGAGEELRQYFIDRTPNKNCVQLNTAMLEHYDRALAALPEMISQVQAHMVSGEPLGELFENTFNG